jgi:hypothetical protein
VITIELVRVLHPLGLGNTQRSLDETRRIKEETQVFQTRQPLSYRSVVRKY